MILVLIFVVLIAGGFFVYKKYQKGGSISVDSDINLDIPNPIQFDD